MKILARTSGPKHESSFIVEVPSKEMARLIGHYYDDGCLNTINSGDVVDVSGMYERLYKLEAENKLLRTTAEKLRSMADLLESIDPIIRAISEEKTTP